MHVRQKQKETEKLVNTIINEKGNLLKIRIVCLFFCNLFTYIIRFVNVANFSFNKFILVRIWLMSHLTKDKNKEIIIYIINYVKYEENGKPYS